MHLIAAGDEEHALAMGLAVLERALEPGPFGPVHDPETVELAVPELAFVAVALGAQVDAPAGASVGDPFAFVAGAVGPAVGAPSDAQPRLPAARVLGAVGPAVDALAVGQAVSEPAVVEHAERVLVAPLALLPALDPAPGIGLDHDPGVRVLVLAGEAADGGGLAQPLALARFDRIAEHAHLAAAVVGVVLSSHVVPGEFEQATNRIP